MRNYLSISFLYLILISTKDIGVHQFLIHDNKSLQDKNEFSSNDTKRLNTIQDVTETKNYLNYSNDNELDSKRTADIKCEEYRKILQKTIWLMPLGKSGPTKILIDCKRRSNALLVGGSAVEQGEFAHMAAIALKESNGKVKFICGGSLISDYWILTAAHCFYGHLEYSWVVLLGSQKLDFHNETQTYQVEKIIIHPAFELPLLYADIALIKLSKRVIFTNNIKPSCLHTKFNGILPKVWATGWGATRYSGNLSNILMKAKLQLISNIECTIMYNNSILLPYGITPGMMCAGDPDNGWKKDTCQGDSGGPIQINHNNNCLYEIVGITSFGRFCASSNSPGVYIRVAYFIDWIESIVWPVENT